MAAPLKKVSGIVNTVLNSFICTTKFCFREAGSTTRRQQPRRRGKHRGWKKLPGDYVEKGMILFRQFGLKVYPGENVGCGRDLTLFALERGRVEMTVETLSPYPESPLYPAVQAGRVVPKMFFHIVPEPQEQKFRLVSQV